MKISMAESIQARLMKLSMVESHQARLMKISMAESQWARLMKICTAVKNLKVFDTRQLSKVFKKDHYSLRTIDKEQYQLKN